MGALSETSDRASRVALRLALLGLFGCTTGAPAVDAAFSGSEGAASDAASSGADDAASSGADDASAGTCQSLRLCAFDCADDACVQACRAKGTASGQAAFDALEACTTKACAKGDVNCACGEQCLADGSCLTAVDACLGTAADPICDNLCH